MTRIFKKVVLDNNKHLPTGFTRHYINDVPAPIPSILQIEAITDKSDGQDCIYLIYYDSEMNEITDTFHENIEHALQQAKFEFNVDEKDWEDIR